MKSLSEGIWYLSHPFAFRHEALQIEKYLEQNLGINLLNPFYETFEKQHIEEFDAQRQNLPEFRIKQLEKYGPEYVKKIVDGDLAAIARSSGVIALVPQAFSIGTFMEIWEAGIRMKKPVYTMIYSKAVNHPWIQYASNAVFPVNFTTDNEHLIPIDVIGFVTRWKTANNSDLNWMRRDGKHRRCLDCGIDIRFKPLGCVCQRHFKHYKKELGHSATWHKNNLPADLLAFKNRHHEIRKLALLLLGGKCVICGVSDFRLLCINHKDGNGGKELSGHAEKFYRSIVTGKRRLDDLEVRCWNHNMLYEFDVGRRSLPTGFNFDILAAPIYIPDSVKRHMPLDIMQFFEADGKLGFPKAEKSK